MKATVERARVLIVDDEPAVLRMLTRVMAQRGYRSKTARDGREASELFEAEAFDVVVSDVHMPGYGGMEFLRRVRETDPDLPVIVMTGKPTLESSMKALEYRAFRYLFKPIEANTVAEIIELGARSYELAKQKRAAFELQQESAKTAAERRENENAFVSAVSKLWLAFQPIVSFKDRRVVGYEALMRSDEPTMRTPDRMLKAAEQLSKLEQLGRAIRGIAAGTKLPPDVKLFVNLHARDLAGRDLFSEGAPLSKVADRVVLEVTERASLDDLDGLDARIGRLKAQGFQIAVDDLGAGYAGLSSLMNLQPNIAKIDMSLVRGIDQDPRKQSIIKSLVWLCKELAIEVIAEGVETTGERDTLVGLGCDLFQGYLFGRPSREPTPAVF
jgi:EAL domain-containing protein (putative c-di-GMP-specific phosphodiesterase class I)